MDTTQINRTTVYLVEDSAAIRSRIAALLTKLDGVAVIGEAEDPATAIRGILASRPDFVILDIQLIGGTGMEVLRAVRAQAPDIVFIVLTNKSDRHYRQMYLGAGASHFFDKSTEFRAMTNLIAAARPHPGQ